MDTAGQHDVLCHVSFLYYPNQGVIVQSALCDDFHKVAEGQINNVMPDTPVTILHLSETAPTFEAMLSTLQLLEREMGQIRYNAVDWKGYGFYAP